MSRVRFHAGDIELELTGSESFVMRQMRLLARYLGRVDCSALGEAEAPVAPASPEAPVAEEAVAAAEAEAPRAEPAGPLEPEEPAPAPPSVAVPPARPANGGASGGDELLSFYSRFQPAGLDRQSDAALLFAYYLQRREGLGSLQLSDLIRCCIRAGVDTRNFNRTLGTLTRRGYLETLRHGQAYRLSEQGVAAVESRM